jgi:sugar/nucleoside kinase (ribokinase family)
MQYASWSLIVDDIVFPDGRTAMGVLGGGGTHTVAGMRVWSEDVGLLGQVGSDLDETILRPLDLRGHGLRRTERPTPRAWQLFETDGHRTQIPRMALEDWSAQLIWPDDFVAFLQANEVRAVHLMSRGAVGDPERIERVAAAGLRISLEPIIEEGMTAEEAQRVLACARHAEIFSPGTAELRVLLGERPSYREALLELCALGPAVVALRRGAAGSVVCHGPSGRFLRVPAARARVVDVTGAGNAYSGGLLVGWCESGDLAHAAACAAVSAALAIEQIGPATITPELLADARERHAEVLAALQEVGDDDEL